MALTDATASQDSQQTDSPIPPALLREIRRISFLARKRASEGMFGRYRSAFKGQGIEFEELRVYVPGDDVRSIHWGATARSQIPQIKRYREERELQVLLAIDVSASRRSGTGAQLREDLLAQLGATLACIALTNNDKVGLLTFSDKVECFIPPRKTRGSIWRIIHEILYPDAIPSPRTDLRGMCEFLRSVIKRRTVVFLISDFIDTGFDDALTILARRHDVSAFCVQDPSERDIPNVGLLRICDPESGSMSLFDTSDPEQRAEYLRRNLIFRSEQRRLFARLQIPQATFWTNEPFVPILRTFFDTRRAKTIAVR